MKIIKVHDYQEVSQQAGTIIMETIKKKEKPVLGLATGSTPEGLYQNLIAKNKQGEVSFQNVRTFNLDEYIGLGKNHPNSYYYYMKEKLFDSIDIQLENVFIPDGMASDHEKECLNYESKLQEVGFIDVQVLGLGLNGHIGFNEPGTSFSSRTHMVELAESTRKANARFFSNGEEVPHQAITMGIESIMNSKKIILLVSGEKKKQALHRLLQGEVTEQFPASILKNHPDVTIIADEESFGR